LKDKIVCKKKKKHPGYWNNKRLVELFWSLNRQLGRIPLPKDFQQASGSAYIALLRQNDGKYITFLTNNNLPEISLLPERIKLNNPPAKAITKEQLFSWRKEGYCISFQITYRRNSNRQLFYCTLVKKRKTQYAGWVSRELMREFVSEDKICEIEFSDRTSIGVSNIIDEKMCSNRYRSNL